MEEEKKSRFWQGFAVGAVGGVGLALILAIVTAFSVSSLVMRRAELRNAAKARESAEARESQTEPAGETPAEQDAFLSLFGEMAGGFDSYFVLDCDKEAMEEAALKAYIKAAGDPYSEYMTAREYTDYLESFEGSYCGIGVAVNQDPETMRTVVVNVFSESSAREQGMKPGDILTAVEGTDVTKLHVDDIVAMIRGEEHTYVKVTVYREYTDEYITFDIERRIVQVDTVYYEMRENGVGYIELTQFEAVSAGQVRSALEDLQSQGMKSLIMDLRNNPGGRLDSVLDIMDLFIDKGELTFYMEDKSGQVYRYYSEQNPLFKGPMAVLANGNSASASEVFIGCMKDYGRAVIMGEKSFGKGIVQSFLTLSDGSALKLTTEHYFTPAGISIHGIGIEPDVAGADDPLTEDTDELIAQAEEYLKGKK